MICIIFTGKRNKRPANAQNQEKEIVSPEPEENGNTADEAVNDQKIQEPIKVFTITHLQNT